MKVHGHTGVRWLAYLNGGTQPRGDDFLRCVRELCSRAGVAFPGGEPSSARQDAAREREERRGFLDALAAVCEDVLWGAAGEAARSYLCEERHLGEGDIRASRLGLLVGTEQDVLRALAGLGWAEEQASARLRAGWAKLWGYITLPWMDEHGRPLTVYGRWPGAPPLMKDVPAWKKKREEKRRAWECGDLAKGWEEPAVPKTFALPGAESKSSPYLFDRVRRAGHKEVVVVEGVFDALLLQARGETRAAASVAAQLSGSQLEVLRRCGVERVFIAGDPDGGGDRGTEANVLALARHGVTPYVVPRLPEGLDPDELVHRDGVEAWRAMVRQSRHGYRHLAEALLARHGERQAGDDLWADDLIARAVADARGLPAGRPDEVARHFLAPIAGATGASVEDLKARLCGEGGVGGGAADAPSPGAEAKPPAAEGPRAAGGYRPKFIDTPTLLRTAKRPTWIVQGMFISGPPVVVGAAKKCMKTSLMVDLMASLGSGAPFLGHFKTSKKLPVAMLSGEWDDWATAETIRRVMAARGIAEGDIDAVWEFDLPRLAVPADLAALTEALVERGRKVLVIDPLYLALLAGQTDLKASNLFDMGPLLLAATKAIRAADCMPIYVHHAVKGLKPGETMELEHLAMAGIAEFARQWLLLNRLEPFDPNTGVHKLWASYGSSAGATGACAIEIAEGRLAEDFGGRAWGVKVQGAGEAVQQMRGAKEAEAGRKKSRQDKDDESKLLNALDALAKDPKECWPVVAEDGEGKGPGNGLVRKRARTKSGLSAARFDRAEMRLEEERRVEAVQVWLKSGKGGAQRAPGVRRAVPPVRPTGGDLPGLGGVEE